MFKLASAAFFFLLALIYGRYLAVVPGGVQLPSPFGTTTATARPTASGAATQTATAAQSATPVASQTPTAEQSHTPTASPTQGGEMGMAVRQTNLVSDVPGQAAVTDPKLVNAWGLARSATGPFWVADNHTGVSTLYNGSGQPFPITQPLVVVIPPPPGSDAGTTSAPTGLVFNSSASDFIVSSGATSGPSAFIFSTEDGTIAGWNQSVSAGAAILKVDRSADEAIYKGLALAENGTARLLYATDFHNNRIDVFDTNFNLVQLTGSFTDPNIPSGFAPFGIAAIEGQLYVTYAQQDEDGEDDVPGPGNGYIDVFNTDGTFVKRFASQGVLDSPWGLVVAPAGFGSFGNTLLVGNFGDGQINAFDLSTGAWLGNLTDGTNPIVIDGLWALEFGNGANAGDVNTLYFTAGPDDETHGLFGMLQPL